MHILSRLTAILPLLCFVFFILLLARVASADDKPSKEYLVKAAFLYNFTKFVDWPVDSTNLNICLFGEDKFKSAIDKIEKKSSAKRRYIILRNPANPLQCHIAYLAMKNALEQQNLLDSMRKYPILTVGEEEEFAALGGVIAFVKRHNKIKLVVNLPAAQNVKLRVDSQLLEVALRVIERK